MLVKTHKAPDGKTLVTVCDTELFGKKFEEGDKQLDLTTDFYNGDEADEQTTGDIMRNADILNIVGEKSIELAKKEGLIEENKIITIDKIPHAQIILCEE